MIRQSETRPARATSTNPGWPPTDSPPNSARRLSPDQKLGRSHQHVSDVQAVEGRAHPRSGRDGGQRGGQQVPVGAPPTDEVREDRLALGQRPAERRTVPGVSGHPLAWGHHGADAAHEGAFGWGQHGVRAVPRGHDATRVRGAGCGTRHEQECHQRAGQRGHDGRPSDPWKPGRAPAGDRLHADRGERHTGQPDERCQPERVVPPGAADQSRHGPSLPATSTNSAPPVTWTASEPPQPGAHRRQHTPNKGQTGHERRDRHPLRREGEPLAERLAAGAHEPARRCCAGRRTRGKRATSQPTTAAVDSEMTRARQPRPHQPTTKAAEPTTSNATTALGWASPSPAVDAPSRGQPTPAHDRTRPQTEQVGRRARGTAGSRAVRQRVGPQGSVAGEQHRRCGHPAPGSGGRERHAAPARARPGSGRRTRAATRPRPPVSATAFAAVGGSTPDQDATSATRSCHAAG